jgi:hypothetical protein
MGKLLALSLMSTLAAAVLFQPVLMGKPRDDELAKNEPNELAPNENELVPSDGVLADTKPTDRKQPNKRRKGKSRKVAPNS